MTDTNDKAYFTLPRLYINGDLDGSVTLSKSQAHYLKTVLRRSKGDAVRVFNGQDGEYYAELSGNASLAILEKTKPQPQNKIRVHMIFAPLKKDRMRMMIEKCTELGVTDFHPIITARTEVKITKPQRYRQQIIEACEQSERLDIPEFHASETLHTCINNWSHEAPIYAALERHKENAPLFNKDEPIAFCIGPVGGFNDDEHEFLSQHKHVRAISLGQSILRAETAAILCAGLAYARQL